MSGDRATGEIVGIALACLGGALLLLSAFVPVFSGPDETLLDGRKVPDGYGYAFVGGGFVTALLATVAFLSEHGRYAVLAVVIAIATYSLAIVLAWGDTVTLAGRGPGIYLSVIGATVAAIGAILCALFAPDYLRTTPSADRA